jgi:acyl-CoA synthetase (AMP-forming)/AMP-acid ligase II
VEQGVTHVSATPTFWRLYGATHALEAPVTGVRQVTVGGEAATDEGLAALRRQFPSAQVSHVYATTELGTCFSVSDGRAGFPSAWLDDAARRLGLRIVEGELQVRRQEQGAPPGPWGATGDLVERVGERVFFRGRVTELINVGGVKVAPLAVEELLLRVPGVLHARVWGKPNPVTGQLVAASLVLAPTATRETVEPLLRAAVLSLPRVQQPRHVEFLDALPEVNLKLSRRTPGESP